MECMVINVTTSLISLGIGAHKILVGSVSQKLPSMAAQTRKVVDLSLNSSFVDRRLMRRWIGKKLELLGIPGASNFPPRKIDEGIQIALKRCCTRLINDGTRIDRRSPIALKNRNRVIKRIVKNGSGRDDATGEEGGKSDSDSLFGDEPQQDIDETFASLPNETAGKCLGVEYHELQDKLLGPKMKELRLQDYAMKGSDELDNRWRSHDGTRLTMEEFCSLIDIYITKYCFIHYVNFDQPLSEAMQETLEILTQAVLLRLERFRKDNSTWKEWKEHVSVVVSFMSGVAMLAIADSSKATCKEKFVLKLEVNGVNRINLQQWVEDKLVVLKIPQSEIEASLKYAMQNIFFRVNDSEEILDQTQKTTSLLNRKKVLDSVSPKTSDDHDSAPGVISETDLEKDQNKLLKSLGVQESSKKKTIAAIDRKITKNIWEKKSAKLSKELLDKLNSASVLCIEFQWVKMWDLSSAEEYKGFIDHVGVTVSLITAFVVTHSCLNQEVRRQLFSD